MLAVRKLFSKPRLVAYAVRPLVIRGLSSTTIRTMVPKHEPLTAAPGYSIVESMKDYQVDVNIPRGFANDNVKVEVDPDSKHIHVSGTHQFKDKLVHFEENFASGHALDVKNIHTDVQHGHLHLQAPKVQAPAVAASPTKSTWTNPDPVTATPGYNVKESNETLQVDMDIPPDFSPEDVKMEVEDAKHIHVTGRHEKLHFDKTFSSGHALDLEHTEMKVENGHLHLEAPKTHATVVPPEAPRRTTTDAAPVTTAPAYDIKENNETLSVDMDIPEGFDPQDIQVELEPDGKHIHVEGKHGGLHFDKHFASGHQLDHLEKNTTSGHLHVEAPKTHAKAPPTPVPPRVLQTQASHKPITVAVGYDVFESNDSCQIDMDIPLEFDPKEVKVELEAQNKTIHVQGTHGNQHFDKSFSAGHAIDPKGLKVDCASGHLHVEAPKSHL